MARLDRARAQWNRFEKEDKPAFDGWLAREFGALLSATREVEDKIREKEMLIEEVEIEMQWEGRSWRTAYQRVIYRRSHPSAARDHFEAVDPDVDEDDPLEPGEPSDFEKEALFQDWLRQFLGLNPDKLDERSYRSTFEAFSFHMFGEVGKKATPDASPRSDAPQKSIGARLKELYRLLVRRLHPDARADGDAAVSSLWHEVQEAYAAGNIERLETLLALSDIEVDKLDARTTLFRMRTVLEELKTALRNLQRSLRAARRDDAWDFARRSGGEALRRRIAQQLDMELATRIQHLRTLESVIASWLKPAPVKRRRPKETLDQPRFAF